MGLEIKEKKTKFMIILWKPYNGNEYVKLGTFNFEIVKGFTYLGTILTNKNELRPEIEKENNYERISISTKEPICTQSRKLDTK